MTVLPPYEQVVLDRLIESGNHANWKPWKRDKDGVALLRSENPIPSKPGWVRVGRCALTTEGMRHYPTIEMKVSDDHD